MNTVTHCPTSTAAQVSPPELQELLRVGRLVELPRHEGVDISEEEVWVLPSPAIHAISTPWKACLL